MMDVNTAHINGYIWEAVVCMHIMWIFYQTELGFRFLCAKMDCDGIRVVAQWD